MPAIKMPEPLFKVINPVMSLMLRSPLHKIFSDSIMLITFTGRNSGRQFTTPVRYLRDGELVRCYTAKENQWWRNLRGGAEVELLTAGHRGRYHASVIVDDPVVAKAQLRRYLAVYPEDAVYHDIRLEPDGSLNATDLDAAAMNAVVVEARPLH